MAGVNKVIIVGRLGRNPEIRYTPDGTAVGNFSVATSEQWLDKNTGEKREKTEWHKIIVWRHLADLSGKYLSKGRQVYVEGRLQTRSWKDENGNTKYQTEIIANQLQFLGSPSDQPREDASNFENKRDSSTLLPEENSGFESIDEEIPF